MLILRQKVLLLLQRRVVITGEKEIENCGRLRRTKICSICKRSRVDELDFALKEEKKQAVSYENELLGLLPWKMGELGIALS